MELPELGTINRKQIASLVGVAPFDNDSGKSCGKRRIWEAELTCVPSCTCPCAGVRFNPTIRSFYQHLRKSGELLECPA